MFKYNYNLANPKKHLSRIIVNLANVKSIQRDFIYNWVENSCYNMQGILLRPFSLKRVQKSIITLSPKGCKLSAYMRFKPNKEKSSRGQRSLCSIDTYRQSSSLGNKRMLSHRKLISLSSLEQKQNLTDRKCNNNETSRQKKEKTQSEQQPVKNTEKNTKEELLNKKRFHFSKFTQYRNDRLHTIQNEQCQKMEKVLQIKQNILKEFIDRFQQQLKEISQKKSSRKTILTHRLKTQNAKPQNVKAQNARSQQKNLKQQTTKKPRTQLNSLESNRQTLNISKCMKDQNKQTLDGQQLGQMENTRFQQYIQQLKEHKKKDHKIFVMKNHKRSLQNISISKIGETENVTSRRVDNFETRNKKLNLKELFKHSKKYQPYLKDSQTINLLRAPPQIPSIKQIQSKLQRSQLKMSPIQNKQNIEIKEPSVYADCSSISNLNQSSFISEVGRKSLLKHLSNQSAKLMRDQQKKTKKCLAKIKSIFPQDFF